MSEHGEWMRDECNEKFKKRYDAHLELISAFETYWPLINVKGLPDVEDVIDLGKIIENYIEAEADFSDALELYNKARR
jgi:hypothetical protein